VVAVEDDRVDLAFVANLAQVALKFTLEPFLKL